MIVLTTSAIAVLITLPFSWRAWRQGRKEAAVLYLAVAAMVGYLLGRNLFIEISPGVL